MENQIEDHINQYTNNNKNTSDNILQIMRKTDKDTIITFNKLGKTFKSVKQDKKKLKKIFNLLEIIFDNLQDSKSKKFIETLIFEEIKGYVYQNYFSNQAIPEYIKTDILKWYEIFFGDKKYEELVQTITDIRVLPGDFVNDIKKSLENFEDVKNQYEISKRNELKIQMKNISAKIVNHPRIAQFLDSSHQEHIGLFFNMTEYVEKLDKEKKEVTKEDLVAEVGRYRDRLRDEVEILRKEFVREHNL